MRKEYTQEFRDRAVELTLRADRSVPMIAEELGVNPQTLYSWCRQYRRRASNSGSSETSRLSQAEEIAALRKELKRVTEERDILKKAVCYFASPPGK